MIPLSQFVCQSRTYSLVQRVEAVGQGIRRIRAVLEMGI